MWVIVFSEFYSAHGDIWGNIIWGNIMGNQFQ